VLWSAVRSRRKLSMWLRHPHRPLRPITARRLMDHHLGALPGIAIAATFMALTSIRTRATSKGKTAAGTSASRAIRGGAASRYSIPLARHLRARQDHRLGGTNDHTCRGSWQLRRGNYLTRFRPTATESAPSGLPKRTSRTTMRTTPRMPAGPVPRPHRAANLAVQRLKAPSPAR
jgi:hypothetical protein